MLATGTDAIAGQQDWNKIRYADDTIMLCVQGASHWTRSPRVLPGQAYNGHDAKLIDSRGLSVLASSIPRTRWSGGVLLDIARFRGVKWMQDGESISNDELDQCAKQQNVSIGRGDFVIIRTGQMERCLSESSGAAMPAATRRRQVENCYWCQDKQIAAICSDTWGVEVRRTRPPRPTSPALGVIPSMACAWARSSTSRTGRGLRRDGIYEFFFCGPPLIITAAPARRSIRRR